MYMSIRPETTPESGRGAVPVLPTPHQSLSCSLGNAVDECRPRLLVLPYFRSRRRGLCKIGAGREAPLKTGANPDDHTEVRGQI